MSPDLFMPASERVKVIARYAEGYDIHTFMETGTAEGFTTNALLDIFAKIYTVEIDPELWRAAARRFHDYPHVFPLLGDSAHILPILVPTFTGPMLFWLDGHFCGGPGRGPIDTPIRAELLAAVGAPRGSVILIDDARLFGGQPEHTEEFRDYPDTSWVKTVANENGFDFEHRDDIFRLTPRDVQDH